MTTLDDEILPLVKSLIEEFGKNATFTLTGKTYDPTTGGVTLGAPSTAVVKVTPPVVFNSRYVDGEIIRVGDVQIIAYAKDLAFVPDVGMEITIDAQVMHVIAVNKIYSGEQVAAYELQLRK